MIKIHDRIKNLLPQVRMAFLQGTLSDEIPFKISHFINHELDKDKLDSYSVVNNSTRSAYKKLGKQPSRYRPSAEGLMRRVKKGLDILPIGNSVDIINCISLESGFSISLFDFDKIHGHIILDIGNKTPYHTIGRGILNIENLPCLFDDIGPFGNPSSDAGRTMIENSSSSILLVIYDFGSNELLSKTLDKAELFLKNYCNFSCNAKGIC